MNILAIDPGANGAFAWSPGIEEIYELPMLETEGDLVEFLQQFDDKTIVFLEEVGGYVGKQQPGSAMFKFGRNFGFILGVCMTLGHRVNLVRPQKWTKDLGLGTASHCGSKAEWKRKLKSKAQQLYPQIKVTLQNADALLILDYGLKYQLCGPAIP